MLEMFIGEWTLRDVRSMWSGHITSLDWSLGCVHKLHCPEVLVIGLLSPLLTMGNTEILFVFVN